MCSTGVETPPILWDGRDAVGIEPAVTNLRLARRRLVSRRQRVLLEQGRAVWNASGREQLDP